MQVTSNNSNFTTYNQQSTFQKNAAAAALEDQVDKMSFKASKTSKAATELMQSDPAKYRVISTTTESDSSESLSGNRKVEEVVTTKRTISQKELGGLLDISI